MKITFLGTGGMSAVPVWSCNCAVCQSHDAHDQRMNASILVEIAHKNILIDFGPCFRQQMLAHKIKHLDYALLTHHHADHCAGFDFLTAAAGCQLLMPRAVYRKFFSGARRGLPKWLAGKKNGAKLHKGFAPFTVGNWTIDSIKLDHTKEYAPLAAMPCYGYLFKSKAYTFAYCSDFIKILEPEKVKGLDLLICDGGHWQTQAGHIGVETSAKFLEQYQIKHIVYTHISHKMGTHAEFSKFLAEKYHGRITVAYDGMVIEV